MYIGIYLLSSGVTMDLADLIDGTWDEASNVLVLSKGVRKGCAEGRCCLHCWKAHFTCSNHSTQHVNQVKMSRTREKGRRGEKNRSANDKMHTRNKPIQSVSTNPKMPLA